MLDLQQLQTIAQLIDNIDISIENLEEAFKDNNAEIFNKSKKEVLESQNKISGIMGEQ